MLDMVWLYMHLPFTMSFILASGALARLVIAHDCADADPSQLAAAYAAESDAEISSGLRWYYSAGLGVALACMGGIAISHDHKTIPGQRLQKRHRLAVRFAVAIVLILLPLAGDLNSLDLVGLTTALVAFVLAVDYWGSTSMKESFWNDRRKCEYTAECRLLRKDLEEIKSGGVLDVEELARRNKGEKGDYDLG
jgi:hypothetical protein